MKKEMKPIERVLTTLSHNEPDRVPMFLLLTMHGAKECNVSIKEYFSKAEYVIEGQLKLQKKYSNDCFYPFFYAPIEVEAFGAEVLYSPDGPPNSGMPFISDTRQIFNLKSPDVKNSSVLRKVLETIRQLKKYSNDEVPIIGVAMSPFSLPVMQLGFDKYLDILYFNKKAFNKLMEINIQFCADWSNAQLEAGATAICYFDPVSSVSMVPRELYLKTGFEIAKETIGKIKGPTATHFASGNCLGIADLVPQTNTAVVGVSSKENLVELKSSFRNKLTILGNLNGIEMRTWSAEKAKQEVINSIKTAAPGGGFILSDNHGEIPFQVEDNTLLTIAETVQKHGMYPINA